MMRKFLCRLRQMIEYIRADDSTTRPYSRKKATAKEEEYADDLVSLLIRH